jgi:sugar phosphate isomerase/epimerase
MSNLLIGLQLYTVRDQTALDFKATVRRVAEIGYTGVEFAGYGNLSPGELAALLKETGLRTAGSHVGFAALEKDPEREIDYCLAIGSSHLTVPSLPRGWETADDIRTIAERFNGYGQRCKEKGLTFSFHNHSIEFQQADGKYLLDILLENSDPAYVQLELDTYWVAYANADPIAYLGKVAGRVPLIHLKDMTPERTFTEVGDGILDEVGIIRAAQAAGTQWYIVENDDPTIPSLESARRSLENLKKLV